ncbi:hypothetical protein [Streptomyces rochei]|uniref:aromatic-ring hydroxylase C-terminal domain-containing protein n=1 Tax=Streptomyces rochei TaxID=1928 RepID=UPI00346791FC
MHRGAGTPTPAHHHPPGALGRRRPAGPDRPARPAAVLDGWADRVTALDAQPSPGSSLQGTDRVLVRPDGHVAWAGPGTDGLAEALTRWFGPPR